MVRKYYDLHIVILTGFVFLFAQIVKPIEWNFNPKDLENLSVITFIVVLIEILILIGLNWKGGRKIKLRKQQNSIMFKFKYPELIGLFFSPIWEEIVFRYFFLEEFYVASGFIAVLFNAVVFSLIHLLVSSDKFDLSSFISRIPGGILFCYAYLNSNSIIIAIIIHHLHNLIIIGVLLLLSIIIGGRDFRFFYRFFM